MLEQVIALTWVEQIIACAIFLQTIELLQLHKTFNNQGIWNWNVIKKEFTIFPRPIASLIDLFLSYPNFLYLLILRSIASLLLIYYSSFGLVLFLLFSTLLICLRWRGVFNGGSDYMTVVILSALTVAKLPLLLAIDKNLIALWYITIQLCSSYFIAGLVKLKKTNWRNGKALAGFLNSTIYQPTLLLNKLSSNVRLCQVFSCLIIIFEITFPLTLFHPQICFAFICCAFIFHLANFYIFGLNRFLFAWVACYPALYFCSL